MSKISSQELDLQIQLSLVSKIRTAAQRYKNDPEAGSPSLQSYIAALESLADHIDVRCRGSRLYRETETAAAKSEQRVIAFPGGSAA